MENDHVHGRHRSSSVWCVLSRDPSHQIQAIRSKPSDPSHQIQYEVNSMESSKQSVLSDDDLNRMWAQHIAPKKDNLEYKTKWQWLSNGTWYPKYHPKEFWLQRSGGSGDISRVFHTKGAEEYDAKYHLAAQCKYLLTVNSGENPEVSYLTTADTQITDLKYSGTGSEGDLYLLDLEFKDFDIVFLPQIFEHLHHPHAVMQRVANHLRDGGYLFLNVPTHNIPHMKAIHFIHYQPMMLAVMCVDAGLEVLELDWMGSKYYNQQLAEKGYWSNLAHFIENGKEPFVNEYVNIFQTWILCRKPE